MSGLSIVSVVSLVGWLVLALAAYRSHRVNTPKTIRLALIWACIFVAATFLFSLLA